MIYLDTIRLDGNEAIGGVSTLSRVNGGGHQLED